MAGYGIDQLTRMISNLYSAAFENTSSSGSSSGPLRRVQQYNTDPTQCVTEVTLPYLIQRDNPYIWFPMADDPYYGLASELGYYGADHSTLVSANNVAGASLIANDLIGGSLVATNPNVAMQIDLADTTSVMYSATIEALVQTTDTSGGRKLIAGWTTGSITNGGIMALCVSGGYVEASIGSGALIFSSAAPIADGLVHHIVLTYNADGTTILYVDGAVSASGVAPSGPISSTYRFQIVTLAVGARQFVGSVQHVAAYKQLLSPAQILEHYNSLPTLGNLLTGGVVTENYGAFFAPRPRYYADLQTGGGNTSEDPSAWNFNSGAVYARYPSTILSSTQMWGVVRLAPSWAYNGAPANPSIFRWADSPTSRLILSYTGTAWKFDRISGTGGAASITGAHAAYAPLTLGFYCNATHTAISLNGGNWVTAANTTIPAIGQGLFDIGNGDNQSNCRVYWAVLGLGTIDNAGIAALHAMGNKDPYWTDMPNILTLDPTFLWACKDQTNEPTAEWGVSIYG